VVERSLALLLPLGPVTARAMFGGHALSLEGVAFALIFRNRLYFRTAALTKAGFAKAGGERFLYENASGKTVEMPYCTPPKAALASSAKLLPWAERAVAAARRAARAKATGRAGKAEARPRPIEGD